MIEEKPKKIRFATRPRPTEEQIRLWEQEAIAAYNKYRSGFDGTVSNDEQRPPDPKNKGRCKA